MGLPIACVSQEECHLLRCPLTAPIGLLNRIANLLIPKATIRVLSWIFPFSGSEVPQVYSEFSLVHCPASLVGVAIFLSWLGMSCFKSCCVFWVAFWKWIGALQTKSVCSGSQGDWAPTFPICLFSAAKAWLIMKDGVAIAWNWGMGRAAACTSSMTPDNGTHSCQARALPSWRWSPERGKPVLTENSSSRCFLCDVKSRISHTLRRDVTSSWYCMWSTIAC